MAQSNFTDFQYTDGVYVSPTSQARFSDFEKNYLAVREKEKRILSIEEIKKLPFADKSSPDYALWKIRQKNILRFLKYLSKKNNQNILDIGCGNGFFTNLMHQQNHHVVGVDINLYELKQAASAFHSSGIKWYYLDILNEKIPEIKFDMITFCSSFQYFKDPDALLKRCNELLTENGEIHIIDSPFYSDKTKKNAQQNSLKYFQTLGFESMTGYYNHNTLDVLQRYNYQFKYKPNKILNRIFRIKDSPFPWICILKKQIPAS